MGIQGIQADINSLADDLKNIRFQRLLSVCEQYFGDYRIRGSHHVFKTPWPGEPFVNLQKDSGGKAKPYQVRQVIRALEKLQEVGHEC